MGCLFGCGVVVRGAPPRLELGVVLVLDCEAYPESFALLTQAAYIDLESPNPCSWCFRIVLDVRTSPGAGILRICLVSLTAT
jgi:hypothetical protein